MIVQTQTTSFKKELYEGIHDLLTDTIRIALYTALADLNESTTTYSATNEVVGPGYTAGGNILTGASVSSSGKTAFVTFNNSTWTGASITCRGALIYNASKANRSIAVLNFGSDKIIVNGNFQIQFPPNTANSAIIRSSN
jgi:hypothetical protein